MSAHMAGSLYGLSVCVCVSLRGVFPFCISHKQDPPSPLPSVFPSRCTVPPPTCTQLDPESFWAERTRRDYGSGWMAKVSRDSVGLSEQSGGFLTDRLARSLGTVGARVGAMPGAPKYK